MNEIDKVDKTNKINEMDEIIKGLFENPKSIPSKFFYDFEGSRLFDEITNLEEYYITQCEKEILFENADFFLSLYESNNNGGNQNRPLCLIELGPGNGSKAGLLIEPLLRAQKKFSYHAIDISPRALRKLTDNLHKKFPTVFPHVVVGDYMSGISRISSEYPEQQNIVLFLGSSIGNLDPDEAHHFIKNLASQLKPQDYLIIGFDLKKDERLLWRAYNDPRGLTADFNLNLLRRINREFGANFNLSNFSHFEVYNPGLSAMESYLISRKNQVILFEENELELFIEKDEMIHTEKSFKFDKKIILNIIGDTGLTAEHFLFDKKNYVTLGIFKPVVRH